MSENDQTSTQGQNQSQTTGNTQETELNALQTELQQTQEKLKEMTGITQHALADLQNFRRRAEEERASYISYANAGLLTDLIPVLENINKALAHEPKDTEWIKGAESTMLQFQNILSQKNLKPIDALNQKFDPNIHEALLTGPGEKDLVIQEFEKGYMLGDKVLKRARVQVGNGEQAAPA